jgi:hypothetical protein
MTITGQVRRNVYPVDTVLSGQTVKYVEPSTRRTGSDRRRDPATVAIRTSGSQPQQEVEEFVLVHEVVLLVVEVVAELEVDARTASVTSV